MESENLALVALTVDKKKQRNKQQKDVCEEKKRRGTKSNTLEAHHADAGPKHIWKQSQAREREDNARKSDTDDLPKIPVAFSLRLWK